jgi:hypothetical protein
MNIVWAIGWDHHEPRKGAPVISVATLGNLGSDSSKKPKLNILLKTYLK